MKNGARLVVTGVDSRGRAVMTSDRVVVERKSNDVLGVWSASLWKIPALPPTLTEDGTPTPGGRFPGPGALLYGIMQIPAEKTLREHPAEVKKHYGRELDLDSNDRGMHRTDSVDLIIILSGELWCKLEDSEVLLKAGDSLVQRGVTHAWRNRGDEPCVMAAIVIGAPRQGGEIGAA